MANTPRRRGTTAALSLLLLASGVMLAPQAAAMVEWSEPAYAIEPGDGGRGVSVVTDSAGDAWVLVDSYDAMALVEHPADGGEPLVQTLPGRYGGFPTLVIDADDRLTLVYNTYADGGATVTARAVSPDGTIGPPQVVSSSEHFPNQPHAAVAPDGVVTVVWSEIKDSDPRTSRVRMARLAPATAEVLGPPVSLDEPVTVLGQAPQVASDDDGEMTVAWLRWDWDYGPLTKPPGVFAVRIDVTGVPGQVRRVSPRGMGVVGEVGDVVVGPRDGATIVWTADTGPRSTRAARLPADGGAVTGRVRVSEPDEPSVGAPAATVDPQGRVTVVWARRSTPPGVGVRYVESRRLSASGQPQRVRPALGALDRDGPSETLGVVADADGFVTVVWPARDAQTYSSYASRIHSVRLDPRGRPSSERRLDRDLGEHFHVLDVALAPDSSVVATWLNYGGTRIARSAPSSAPLVPAETGFLKPLTDTTDRRPKVVLYSSVVAATFECRLDRGAWRPCAWRSRLPRLTYGDHRLAVRSTDPDGTGPDPTPAVTTFAVVRG